MYVYDPVNSLRKLSTPAGITDIAFHPTGTWVYMAGQASTMTVLDTCDNTVANNGPPTFTPQVFATTPGVPPQFVRALPVAYADGSTHFLVWNGPNATGLDEVAGIAPQFPVVPTNSGCLSSGFGTTGPYIANSVSAFDLHQGIINATQFLVAPDGSKAYVVPQNFSGVFGYDILTHAPTSIALVGAKPPTTAGLTTDGKFLLVGSTDGLLHVLDTTAFVDTQQILLSTNSSPAVSMCSISSATQPCHPDFVVVKP